MSSRGLPQVTFLSGIMCWRAAQEPLLKVDFIMARSSFLQSTHINLQGSGLFFSMTTPNGRFVTQKKICLSMSDFHPESWNPMWSVSSILTGLLSFMMDTSPTTGSVTTTAAEKHHLAKASLAFNCKNTTFRKLFPEHVEKYNQQQLAEQTAMEQLSPAPPHVEKSRRSLDTLGNRMPENVNRVEAQREARNNKKQLFPIWMLILLLSIFGFVMALPLIQL